MHAPTHYYWSRYDDYLRNPGFGAFDWLARLGLKLLVGPLRRWDLRAAQRPDLIIANSTHTQTKIKEYYGRDSVVVFPPVDTERFAALPNTQRSGFVVAGRQTPYKRIDLAVAACTIGNRSLTVIGTGPEHEKLRAMAGPTITFVTDASDKDVANYFAGAEAFIFPGLDDFGIVAVEAMAAGTPVIAYRAGGALDYVQPGLTGMFFEQQTPESLAASLKAFDAGDYAADDIKAVASRFSAENFQKNLRVALNEFLDKRPS
jgi:glycosyltransferase involved in cell wall biosynthesis